MNNGDTAAERIRQRNQFSERLLWWWRVPFLAILAVAVAVIWITIGGLFGVFVAALIVGLGIWIATLNPWARQTD